MPSERIEEIARVIVNSAFKVHKELGPGLLEKIYEACLAYEIEKAGLIVKRQVDIPIIYDGIQMNEKLRLELIVEKLVNI